MEQQAEWGGAHCQGDTQQTEVSILLSDVLLNYLILKELWGWVLCARVSREGRAEVRSVVKTESSKIRKNYCILRAKHYMYVYS